MNLRAYRAALRRPLGVRGSRTPAYITQFLYGNDSMARVKRVAEKYDEANSGQRKADYSRSQLAKSSTSFVVSGSQGNGDVDKSCEVAQSDLNERAEAQLAPDTSDQTNADTTDLPLKSSSSESAAEKSDSDNEQDNELDLSASNADMSNRVSATRSRHEDFEQQKIVLARLTNDRGEWRKPNIPLTLQKATLLGLTGSLRYSATSEKKRPLAEPISIEADLLALRRSLMPIATKTTADTNVFDAATNTTAVKFPAVDRTLESEFLRFKPNSLLDPNRESVANLQRTRGKKNSPLEALNTNKTCGAEDVKVPKDKDLALIARMPMTVQRAVTHAHEELFLKECSDRHHCEHHHHGESHSCESSPNETCPEAPKRESTCLKHQLLPPLPRCATMPFIPIANSSNKPNPKSVDESSAKSSPKPDVCATVSPSSEKQDELSSMSKSRSFSLLWSNGNSTKRRRRSFSNEITPVRRNSKGKLKPLSRSLNLPKSIQKPLAQQNLTERSCESSSASDSEELCIHTLEEEPTLLESARSKKDEHDEAVVLTHRSHRSARSARSARPVSKCVSRLTLVPPETEADHPLSSRSRASCTQSRMDGKTGRVSAMLRGMLRHFKMPEFAHEDRIVIIPRNELLFRFRKLDTDSDGHLTLAQLESSLPTHLSTGQRLFIKAVYNLSIKATFFGFEEFTGVHALCNRLELLKNDLLKQSFAELHEFALEAAIEYFLNLFEDLLSELPRALRQDPRKATVHIDKILDAFSMDEMLQKSSDSNNSKILVEMNAQSSEVPESATESRLQLIRRIFEAENQASFDQSQFLIFIPLFLVLFKPDKFKNQIIKRSRTLLHI